MVIGETANHGVMATARAGHCSLVEPAHGDGFALSYGRLLGSAAALAELGRFPEAEEAAARGAELATRAGRPQQAAELEARRELYASRRPYRSTP